MWTYLGIGALLVSVAATAGTPGPGGDGRWHTFVSEVDRFEVELPADPVVSQDDEHLTAMGTVTGTVYAVSAGDLELTIEVRSLPALAKALVPADVVLERTRRGVTSDLDAVEVEGGVVTLQGLPARAFVYRIPGDPPVLERALVVLVDGDLYVVTGREAHASPSAPDLEHFFASFHFRRSEEDVSAR